MNLTSASIPTAQLLPFIVTYAIVSTMTTTDPSSFANVDDVQTSRFHLAVSADFSRKVLTGSMEISFSVGKDVDHVILDSRNLVVKGARLASGSALNFSLGEVSEAFGQAIKINLGSTYVTGSSFTIVVDYETTPESTAIQWLSPSQTAGKVHPYMFTQCQAIHCRSLMPCQDSPAVKATYTAELTVPRPLVALMSAEATGCVDGPDADHQRYTFQQTIPVPAYLVAIAIGDLVSREIGPRSRVWSEASVVDAGAAEFADTESFIAAAESFLPPYAWGRYDLLLMPPSFPYGGMENPMLTFVTPTLLAGDRSLANVVAHEIAHSWSGNLVTNKRWDSFWLNEGWTVFIERKIQEKKFSKAYADLAAYQGWTDLAEDVKRIGETHTFTALTPKIEGIDPDDSYSSVPYEKGAFFLHYLQSLVGPREMEAFAHSYFEKFALSTVTTEQFKEYFLHYFKAVPAVAAIDWETWLHAPGMPPYKPDLDMSLLQQAKDLAARWKATDISGLKENEIASWMTLQKITFLDEMLAEPLPTKAAVYAMKDLYKLDAVRNAEIRFRFQTLLMRVGAEPEYVHPMVKAFVAEQGRMKYLRPLYRELAKSEQGRSVAIETFREHHRSYHSIAQKMVGRDLGVDPKDLA